MSIRPAPRPRHKRRVPKRRKRNAFSRKVRKQILNDVNYCCQNCGRRATQIHHVMPRSRSGRGVYTNGMAICNACHEYIHKNNDMLKYWIKVYEERYGKDFYKDEYDRGCKPDGDRSGCKRIKESYTKDKWGKG